MQGETTTSNASRQNALNGLLRVLANLDSTWNPQVVVVSGDIGWRGSTEDYIKAEVWFKGLLDFLKLTPKELVVCVGNHDLDRNLAQVLSVPSTSSEVDRLLTVENISTLYPPFDEFKAFCQSLGIPQLFIAGQNESLFGYRKIAGLQFVVLNSAWFSRNDTDKGKLWVGLPLLKVLNSEAQLVDPQEYDIGTLTIAVLHHPMSWLHESEQSSDGDRLNTYRYLCERTHIILSGHEHNAIEKPHILFSRAHAFAAGATYSGDNYRNNFSLLQIDTHQRNITRRAFEYDPRYDEWREAPVTSDSLMERVNQNLGSSYISVFQRADEFFAPFLNKENVFTHAIDLIGRTEYLQQLVDFTGSTKRVAILSGRGGIGKSKIILEAIKSIEKNPDVPTVLFLRDGAYFRHESITEFPKGKLLIVVEDAHRDNGLKQLISTLNGRDGSVQLLLSTRPYGLNVIKQYLSEVGINFKDILILPELQELSSEEVRALAKEILGERDPLLIERLVKISKDSPLITVVGGKLIVEKQIDPSLVSNTEEFRYLVLNKFRDTLIDPTCVSTSPEVTKNVLAVVASLAPFSLDDRELVKLSAGFLELKDYELIKCTTELAKAGALLKRGRQVRITPDVLSDFVLEEICFAEGQSTGYSDEIFRVFGDSYLDQILKNFAELDWRISASKGSDILTQIWDSIWESLHSKLNYEILSLLKILRKIAHYQPAQTLDLILYILDNPKETSKDVFYDISHSMLIQDIPPLLGIIARNKYYLHNSVKLLWQLGKNDYRDINPNPEHSIRVLRDLASYSPYVPLECYKSIIVCIREIVDQANAFENRYTPLDVLKKLLDREGERTVLEGSQVRFLPFKIDSIATAPIRNEVLTLFEELGYRKHSKTQRRVLESLLDALRGPLGMFGRTPATDEIESWIPEKLRILDIIDRILTEASNPYLYCKAMKYLKPLTIHDKTPLFRQIENILKKFPDDFEFKLLYFLWSNQPYWLNPGDYNFETARSIVESESLKLSEQLLSLHSSAEEILFRLQNIVELIQSYGDSCTGNYLLTQLARLNPTLAGQICQLLLQDLKSPLIINFSQFLVSLRENHNDEYHEIINVTFAETNPILLKSLAHMFTWFKDYNSLERGYIRKLALQTNHDVKIIALRALGNFSEENRTELFKIINEVDLDGDSFLANQICSLFDDHYGIPIEQIPSWLLEKMLEKLIPISDVSMQNNEMNEFIKRVIRINASLVIEWFLSRIRYFKVSDEQNDYNPVPYPSFETFPFNSVKEEERRNILCLIRDQILKPDIQFDYNISALFALTSNSFDELSLSVLFEWVGSGKPEKMKGVASLLRDAGPNFVFIHEEFTAKLLIEAETFGKEIFKELKSVLYITSSSGGGTGIPGQPMPHHIQLKQNATTAASHYSEGSIPWDFYVTLQKSSEQDIERDTELWKEIES